MASAKYSRPILSRIFDLFACLAFIGSGFSLFAYFADGNSRSLPVLSVVAVLFMVGLFYVGVGQAIDYLARASYNTARANELTEQLIEQFSNVVRQTAVPIKPAASVDEEAVKFRAKVLTFLERIDTQQEHGNALMKWVGERIGKKSEP